MAKLNLFIDTNIIIDLLADRRPFSNAAYVIFKKAKLDIWQLFTSSSSILTTFYILEKHLNTKDANNAIEMILGRIEIQDLTKKELFRAIKSKTKDLDDASQIECANKVGKIDFIITRDKRGFKESIIEVLHPDELLNINLI